MFTATQNACEDNSIGRKELTCICGPSSGECETWANLYNGFIGTNTL
jgi:hypothetical protein